MKKLFRKRNLQKTGSKRKSLKELFAEVESIKHTIDEDMEGDSLLDEMFEDGVLKRGDFPDYINQFRTDKFKPFVDLGEIEVPVRVKKEAVVEMMRASSLHPKDADALRKLITAPSRYAGSGDHFPLDTTFKTSRPPDSPDNLLSYEYDKEDKRLSLSFNKDCGEVRSFILSICKKNRLKCKESLFKGQDGTQRNIDIQYA